MNFLGNLIWLLLGGIQHFKIAKMSLLPFGRVTTKQADLPAGLCRGKRQS